MRALLLAVLLAPALAFGQLIIQGPVFGQPTATLSGEGIATEEIALKGKKNLRLYLKLDGYNCTRQLVFTWPQGATQTLTIYAQLPPGSDQNREWVYLRIGETDWTESVIYYSPFQRQFVHAASIHPQDLNAWTYWNGPTK